MPTDSCFDDLSDSPSPPSPILATKSLTRPAALPTSKSALPAVQKQHVSEPSTIENTPPQPIASTARKRNQKNIYDLSDSEDTDGGKKTHAKKKSRVTPLTPKSRATKSLQIVSKETETNNHSGRVSPAPSKTSSSSDSDIPLRLASKRRTSSIASTQKPLKGILKKTPSFDQGTTPAITATTLNHIPQSKSSPTPAIAKLNLFPSPGSGRSPQTPRGPRQIGLGINATPPKRALSSITPFKDKLEASGMKPPTVKRLTPAAKPAQQTRTEESDDEYSGDIDVEWYLGEGSPKANVNKSTRTPRSSCSTSRPITPKKDDFPDLDIPNRGLAGKKPAATNSTPKQPLSELKAQTKAQKEAEAKQARGNELAELQSILLSDTDTECAKTTTSDIPKSHDEDDLISSEQAAVVDTANDTIVPPPSTSTKKKKKKSKKSNQSIDGDQESLKKKKKKSKAPSSFSVATTTTNIDTTISASSSLKANTSTPKPSSEMPPPRHRSASTTSASSSNAAFRDKHYNGMALSNPKDGSAPVMSVGVGKGNRSVSGMPDYELKTPPTKRVVAVNGGDGAE